jgi:hypothetical protein
MKLFSYAAIALSSALLIASLPAIAQTQPQPTEVEVTEVEVIETETTPTSPSDSMPMPTEGESSMPPATAPKVTVTPTGTVPTATTKVLPQETITGFTTTTLAPPPPIQPIYFTLPIRLEVAQDSSITTDTPISDKYGTTDFKASSAAISACLKQSPKLMRVVKTNAEPITVDGDTIPVMRTEGETTFVGVPFMMYGTEGMIVRNANNKPVCPMQ